MASRDADIPRVSLQLPGCAEDEPFQRPSSRFSIDSDRPQDTRRYGLLMNNGNARKDKLHGGASKLRSLAIGTVGGLQAKAKKSVDNVRQKHKTSSGSGWTWSTGLKKKKASTTWPMMQTQHHDVEKVEVPSQYGGNGTPANGLFQLPEIQPSNPNLMSENDEPSAHRRHDSASLSLLDVASFGYLSSKRSRHNSLPAPPRTSLQSIRSKVSYRLFPAVESTPRTSFKATLSPPQLSPAKSSDVEHSSGSDGSNDRSSTPSTVDSDPPLTPTSPITTPPVPPQHPARTKSDSHRAFNFDGVPVTRFSRIFDTSVSVQPLFSNKDNPAVPAINAQQEYIDSPPDDKVASPEHIHPIDSMSGYGSPMQHLYSPELQPRVQIRPRLSVITMDWRVSTAASSFAMSASTNGQREMSALTQEGRRETPLEPEQEQFSADHRASLGSNLAIIASTWRAYRKFSTQPDPLRPNITSPTPGLSRPASAPPSSPNPQTKTAPEHTSEQASKNQDGLTTCPAFEQASTSAAAATDAAGSQDAPAAEATDLRSPYAESCAPSINYPTGLLAEAMIGVDLPFEHYLSPTAHSSLPFCSELAGSAPKPAEPSAPVEEPEVSEQVPEPQEAITTIAPATDPDISNDHSTGPQDPAQASQQHSRTSSTASQPSPSDPSNPNPSANDCPTPATPTPSSFPHPPRGSSLEHVALSKTLNRPVPILVDSKAPLRSTITNGVQNYSHRRHASQPHIITQRLPINMQKYADKPLPPPPPPQSDSDDEGELLRPSSDLPSSDLPPRFSADVHPPLYVGREGKREFLPRMVMGGEGGMGTFFDDGDSCVGSPV
ncbi:hypothetical protein K461DRAFT_276328 [Myriangium duriaei CBS 260.36]|uniref:Uncharacterized protein n=1 Tax=Myriangium duriaei CBS 260.36 TaxID=1168546 RepID=A0A9P4J490_9PEZI|nr:hypothetical protein K461DRAFT_276328 [Myriangium duriaei CBS 260.36]